MSNLLWLYRAYNSKRVLSIKEFSLAILYAFSSSLRDLPPDKPMRVSNRIVSIHQTIPILINVAFFCLPIDGINTYSRSPPFRMAQGMNNSQINNNFSIVIVLIYTLNRFPGKTEVLQMPATNFSFSMAVFTRGTKSEVLGVNRLVPSINTTS